MALEKGGRGLGIYNMALEKGGRGRGIYNMALEKGGRGLGIYNMYMLCVDEGNDQCFFPSDGASGEEICL